MNYYVYDDMTSSELMVCEFLKHLKIYWLFEQPVYLFDDKERPRIFSPDFYLPELGIYIEVVGNPKLTDYERREMIYQKNRVPIIFVLPNHDKFWRENLLVFIENIHQNRYEKLKRIRANRF